jgi:hypothetical protein
MAKKVMLGIVVLFVGFWLFTDPSGLADAVRGAGGQIWSLATQLFSAVIRFIGEVF